MAAVEPSCKRLDADVRLPASRLRGCTDAPKAPSTHRRPGVAVVAALMGVVVSPLGAAGKEPARPLETPNASDLRFGYGADSTTKAARQRPHTTRVRPHERSGSPPAKKSGLASRRPTRSTLRDFTPRPSSSAACCTERAGDVSFYFAPPSEIAESCGPHAAACYWRRRSGR